MGGQTYACGAFYQESGPNIFHLTGASEPDQSSMPSAARKGNVAINAIKLAAYQWNRALLLL